MILRGGGYPRNIWFQSHGSSASVQAPPSPPAPPHPNFATKQVALCKRWHAETSVVCKVADCITETQQMECASWRIVAQRLSRCRATFSIVVGRSESRRSKKKRTKTEDEDDDDANCDDGERRPAPMEEATESV